MKLKFLIIPGIVLFLAASCSNSDDRIGLSDDFSGISGWMEVNPVGDTVPPELKLEIKDGSMIIHHKFRTLEFADEKWPWINNPEDTSTNLRRNYGTVDLDKYHYVVLNVKEKGSSSYFDINGFTTKLGYTTGTTVIDLKDYDDAAIQGVQTIDFGIDLQDNHTRLVLDDLKFVSKLTAEETPRLIGGGLKVRDENLNPRPYHGLEALKIRENLPLPHPDEEEMATFRDDATGAITTRLTDTPGDDYFGEGGIWSADGSAVKFESSRKIGGIPICIPGEGKIIAGPEGAAWRMWSLDNADIIYLMKRKGLTFSVSSWNMKTRKENDIAQFNVPEVGSYVEFKRFTPLGNIIVGFRETPHLYIIDVHNNEARYIELPTRLKDVEINEDENVVDWANCYTYERPWRNFKTGEHGLTPGFSAGHASWGQNGMVANFGGHLNVFVPGDIGRTFTPGDRIKVWANWENDIVTDYGNLTVDNQYVFTNGTRGDVKNQHLMIPSSDPGAVMRVARYFTKFSWTSTTYSRPSPDYTKLIYNENAIGNTELYMVYVRRPDAPVDVRLDGTSLKWKAPGRKLEIAGYIIYGSDSSGRNFVRINSNPVNGEEYSVDHPRNFYAVTSVEHSGLESSFSTEVSAGGGRSFYFEAENMQITAPARHFFDGYCNNFQCIRINAESDEEHVRAGEVRIPLTELPSGTYHIWLRVKGQGTWSAGNEQVRVSENEWKWVSDGVCQSDGTAKDLIVSAADDDLKLDLVLLTADDFTPVAAYPCDALAPGAVDGFSATANGKQVHLSWNASNAPDLHHYSVYCGNSPDFDCDNTSLIRSVLKTNITDILPGKPRGMFYKVVAVDSRWNTSEPATVKVN